MVGQISQVYLKTVYQGFDIWEYPLVLSSLPVVSHYSMQISSCCGIFVVQPHQCVTVWQQLLISFLPGCWLKFIQIYSSNS